MWLEGVEGVVWDWDLVGASGGFLLSGVFIADDGGAGAIDVGGRDDIDDEDAAPPQPPDLLPLPLPLLLLLLLLLLLFLLLWW